MIPLISYTGDGMSETDYSGRSEIVYEEGWRDAVPSAESAPDDGQQEPVPDGGTLPLLLCIQLALCLIVAAVLFVLKAMDSEAYHSFMTYYRVEMNKPVISQELFETPDIRRLTSGGAQVKASPDEIPPG